MIGIVYVYTRRHLIDKHSFTLQQQPAAILALPGNTKTTRFDDVTTFCVYLVGVRLALLQSKTQLVFATLRICIGIVLGLTPD